MLREKFIANLRSEGVVCNELNESPYRHTMWEINRRRCYITFEINNPWFQVPQSVLSRIDVLIFLTGQVDHLMPYLISAQDFSLSVSMLEDPLDGSYNVNISGYWPNIDMKISAGDDSGSILPPLAGNSAHPTDPLVFNTLGLLYSEDDNQEVTEVFERVERSLNLP